MDKAKKDRRGEVNIERIERLIDLFEKREISELEIEDSGFRLRLKKGEGESAGSSHISTSEIRGVGHKDQMDVQGRGEFYTVSSPIVGTFYRSPSPGADPFVKEGDMVEKGQVLCIIEAMKIMNEIESEVKGKVVSILVENGHPVEYGESLFLIEPI